MKKKKQIKLVIYLSLSIKSFEGGSVSKETSQCSKELHVLMNLDIRQELTDSVNSLTFRTPMSPKQRSTSLRTAS